MMRRRRLRCHRSSQSSHSGAARPWSFPRDGGPRRARIGARIQIRRRLLHAHVSAHSCDHAVSACSRQPDEHILRSHAWRRHALLVGPNSSDGAAPTGPGCQTHLRCIWSCCRRSTAALRAFTCSAARSALLLAAGAGSAFVYTGGPGLKYKALGDILISGTFGPLLVAFTYAVQTGTLNWRPLVASIPLTLHIEAILHANNARDVQEDLASGIKTLAARLGEAMSSQFYAALLALPFLAPLYAATFHSLLAALPMITAPKARKLAADFAAGRFVDLPKRTAKFQFLFAMLFVAGSLLPSPSLATLGRRVVSVFR